MLWANPTGVLAIYGAVVSSALAVVRFVEFWRDRPRVKVSFKPRVVSVPEGQAREYSEIYVVNLGRRSVTINGVGLELNDGRRFVPGLGMCFPRLPVTLEESKNLTAFIRREDLELHDVKRAFAQATDGRVYQTNHYHFGP